MGKISKNLLALKKLFHKALIIVKLPILISMIVTPLRFSLEFAGLPESYIFLVGLLWLTLAFSVYWGVKLYSYKDSFLLLLLGLFIFSSISRIPVAIFWWIDNKWELGTHYGLYFENWSSALLNHIGYGSLVQIIPGFLVGSITIIIMKRKSATISSKII